MFRRVSDMALDFLPRYDTGAEKGKLYFESRWVPAGKAWLAESGKLRITLSTRDHC